jgi:hypothetical protein
MGTWQKIRKKRNTKYLRYLKGELIFVSFPNIPVVDATISITLEDSVNLLLASIAFEELGLSHIINAEAEKIQFVLGTLEDQEGPVATPTIEDLLDIDRAVDHTLRNVLKNQMLLQFKLEDAMSITTTSTTTTTTTTTEDTAAL